MAQVGLGENGVVDDAVRRYRDEIESQHRPVINRLDRLIVDTCPDVEVVLSYAMPTYRIGRRRRRHRGVEARDLAVRIAQS